MPPAYYSVLLGAPRKCGVASLYRNPGKDSSPGGSGGIGNDIWADNSCLGIISNTAVFSPSHLFSGLQYANAGPQFWRARGTTLYETGGMFPPYVPGTVG